jgi:hypothetical protein
MPAATLENQMEPFAGTPIETAMAEWGEMAVTRTRFPAGFDGAAFMAGAEAEAAFCQAPHWGVVLAGSLGVRYEDGSEEVARAGEAFHVPRGHVPFTDEGAEVIEFTPASVMADQMKRAAAALGQQ